MLHAFLISTAQAFDCLEHNSCGCDFLPGNSVGYKINVDDFDAAEETEIETAADAWDAGGGEINRGADWDFIRNADLHSDGIWGDGTNNVRKKPASWWTAQGFPSTAVGATTRTFFLGCGRMDTDMTYRDELDYATELHSELDPLTEDDSLGNIALHEFGHFLGLADDSTDLAVMNHEYPGGDLAGVEHRISEDDFAGLRSGYADSSTGVNLALTRYKFEGGEAVEVWDVYGGETGNTWSGHPGTTITTNGPSEILAVITGTSSESPLIEWRLSADSLCFSGPEHVLGTRTPNLGVNVPYSVGPSGGYTIPSGTPLGDYYLCARIDTNGVIGESSGADNTIRSEKKFRVD